MEYIVETENIALDYSEDRMDDGIMPYRLTLYDKYGHYVDDIILTKDEVKDLYDGLENVKNIL